MNRLDYIAGLLLALLFHVCLLTIMAGLWGGNTTQARPMFPYGESSLAMTFVVPPSAGAVIMQPQGTPPVAALFFTEPEVEEEALASVAIPDSPVQPQESRPAPEQPAEVVEAPSELTQAKLADNASSGTAPTQSGDGAAPQSDADGLSKGIQGLPRMSAGVRPVYPLGARHRGEQGNVTVRVQVGADGWVKRAAIARSSDHLELDQAALKAIRRTRFIPGRKNGVPTESESLITFRFQLVN
jgi:protein TonB